MAIKISCGKGSENLSDFERDMINKISDEFREKIERHFETIDFEVYVKCFYKQGNVKRYVIDAKVIVPGFVFTASVDERKLNIAVHKALEKIMNEIEKRIRLSSQGNKSRKIQDIRERG